MPMAFSTVRVSGREVVHVELGGDTCASSADPRDGGDEGGDRTRHDLFISYAVNPDKYTFVTLRDTFLQLKLNVFNPDVDLAEEPGGATIELMKAHVRASKLVLVIMSRDAGTRRFPIFDSKNCLAELAAAMEAEIPVIPVFNGDKTAPNEIKSFIDEIETLSELGLPQEKHLPHKKHWPLVKYVFREQIKELVSTQNDRSATKKREKVAVRVRHMRARSPVDVKSIGGGTKSSQPPAHRRASPSSQPTAHVARRQNPPHADSKSEERPDSFEVKYPPLCAGVVLGVVLAMMTTVMLRAVAAGS